MIVIEIMACLDAVNVIGFAVVLLMAAVKEFGSCKDLTGTKGSK